MTIHHLPKPELALPHAGEPALRWGLVGPGWIADQFVSAVHSHTAQRFTAVGSRTADRAGAFASRHGIPYAFADYRALVEHSEVDVVYIATPQSEHLQLGLMAIAAGKHLLIEKPLALNGVEAAQLAAAAARANVFIMEAMWTRYLPHMSVVRQLLADGALGEVHSVHADHGQAIPADPSHRLYRPELGGGALLDLGIYPLQLDSMVLGAPRGVTAHGEMTLSGVDAYSTVILDHGGTAQSTVTTTLLTNTPTKAAINGSEARLELDSDFFIPGSVRLISNPTASSAGTDLRYDDDSGLQYTQGLAWEANALAHYVGEGRLESPLHTMSETTSILDTIDQAKTKIKQAVWSLNGV